MLSRVANNLYWISRYIERAENTARIIDVTSNLNLLPSIRKQASELWYPALEITGMHEIYPEDINHGSENAFMAFMALETSNPSSIVTSINLARENALRVRSSLSSEVWETINKIWIELNHNRPKRINKSSILEFCEWIKNQSHLFRGAVISTMIRDDSFLFLRLGTSIERADNTARLLDVKYHLLLPKDEKVGGALDYYEWNSILRSVSGLEAYQKTVKGSIVPAKVTELLILNNDMPRSLRMCYKDILDILKILTRSKKKLALHHAIVLNNKLQKTNINEIFKNGLHEFLTFFIDENIQLSNNIQTDFFNTDIK